MTNPIDVPTFEALKATTGDDFVGELFSAFEGEAPVMLAELRDAQARGDAERFRRTAHSLKSNANTFGALTLAAMARSLELSGIGAVGQGDVPTLAAVESEYARAAAALKVLCNG